MSSEYPDITELRPDVSEVTTDKEINPAQLGSELGTDQVWIDGQRILAAVDKSKLETAITNHVADPSFGEPAEERGLWILRSRAQAIWNDPTTTAWTSQQQRDRILAGLVLMATRRRKS